MSFVICFYLSLCLFTVVHSISIFYFADFGTLGMGFNACFFICKFTIMIIIICGRQVGTLDFKYAFDWNHKVLMFKW